MMRSTPGRLLTLAGLLMLLLSAYRLATGGEGVPQRPPAQAPELPPAPAAVAALAEPRAADDERPGPTPPAHLDPGDDGIPFYGFCPEEGTAPEGVARPQLFEHARLHSEELLDRFLALRRERGGSPELRAGLRGILAARDERAALAQLEQAPDRFVAGFDHARSAAILLGMRALANDPRQARQHARYAIDAAREAGTDDAAAHALMALSARALGDAATERAALRSAHALEPEEPAFNLALGRNLAHTPELDDAVASLDAYLRDARRDVATAQLRARLATAREIQRDYVEHRRGSVTLLSPRDALDAGAAARLTELIATSIDEAARLLGMKPRAELLAVVYRERSELLATTCVPSWSAGVFDGTLRLYADTVKRPDVGRRVVRHEVLHAQLRSERFGAPHWFHEGVAQYFAQETRAAHLRSYRMMVDNRTYIPFASLEGSFLVIDRSRDAGLAYHQSLAMVELMVDRAGKHAIAHAVDYLRREGDPADLLTYVTAPRPVEGKDLLSYLSRKLRRPAR